MELSPVFARLKNHKCWGCAAGFVFMDFFIWAETELCGICFLFLFYLLNKAPTGSYQLGRKLRRSPKRFRWGKLKELTRNKIDFLFYCSFFKSQQHQIACSLFWQHCGILFSFLLGLLAWKSAANTERAMRRNCLLF